jgi:DnaJ-class molecular chaperone
LEEFSRDGADLIIRRNITLMQALLGFEMTVPTLDGGSASFTRATMTSFGDEQKLEGLGLPIHRGGGARGFLRVSVGCPRWRGQVKFNIVFPEKVAVTEERKAALRKAEKKEGKEEGGDDRQAFYRPVKVCKRLRWLMASGGRQGGGDLQRVRGGCGACVLEIMK